MRFVVIGYGFVGQAVYSALSDKHDVDVIDPTFYVPTHDPIFYNRVGRDVNDIKTIKDVDGFIICVPTPALDNGRCDDSLVTDYVKEIQLRHPGVHILIKSTTSIDALSSFTDLVTFSPEFLRGSISADPTNEFRNSEFAIYGGKGGRWWHEIFRELLPIKEVRFLDIESAGFLKYVENSFLATKVMFFNELEQLYTQSIGGNFDAMIEALALDKRINISHTQVPGPDGQYGFGGHCFPKDTSEFTEWARSQGSPLHLLEQARNLNSTYRKK